MVAGVVCAVITPFDGDAIDAGVLRRHLDRLISSGIHGLIVAGSSGEAHLLTVEERRALLDTALGHVGARVPVMLGASAPSTRDTVALCRFAERAGAAGVLLTPPYYYRPTTDELRRYLGEACAASALPVMLYNTPEAVGTDVTPDAIVRLAAEIPLAAVKESSGKLERIGELRRRAPHLAVYVGTDTIALPGLRAGAIGWVTGAANVIPAESVALYDAAMSAAASGAEALGAGAPGVADRLFEQLRPLCAFLEECGSYVPGLKAGMAMRGWTAGAPRLPLLPLDTALAAELHRVLSKATAGSGAPLPV
jgi:4-hydroxy-tetrahydrodipicolinate synthase